MVDLPRISLSTTVKRQWQYFTPHAAVHDAMSRHLILQAADRSTPRRIVTDEWPQRRALIIGAGRCRDIPLRELCDRFDRITINDIDPDKLERGLRDERLLPAHRDKLHIRYGDALCVTERFITAFDALLDDGRPVGPKYAHLIERMAALADSLEPQPMEFDVRFDLVVASCVLSQLHLGVVDHVFARISERFKDGEAVLRASQRWTQSVRELATRMQRAFVAMLLSAVEPRGSVYLSTTPRVRHVHRGPRDQLKWRHRYEMLAHEGLAGFIDAAHWQTEAMSDWQWAGREPKRKNEPGHWFDVEAMVLRPVNSR